MALPNVPLMLFGLVATLGASGISTLRTDHNAARGIGALLCLRVTGNDSLATVYALRQAHLQSSSNIDKEKHKRWLPLLAIDSKRASRIPEVLSGDATETAYSLHRRSTMARKDVKQPPLGNCES